MKEPLSVATRALCAVVVFLSSAGALALETSSAIRGVVTDPAGRPLANATVTVRNETTSLTREAQTNAAGEFSVRNLQVGDYTVQVAREGFADETASNVVLALGEVTEIGFALRSDQPMEELVVTGSRVPVQVATGPNAVFGLKELESLPSINRNIADVLRVDPRIFVDESRGDINAVQCGGKNSRFNSLTVDGVRTNDSFGLNSNGYPTERMPFSYDAIQQVSVELAPFDAAYGGFTACNINAVTKSGGNEFFGGLFYDYTDDDLRSDSLEGDDIETGDFDETRWGINLGGPIIKDKVFFFVAYEELEGANLFDRGALGSGAVDEVDITQAEVDEILDIARTIYQYDPGTVPSGADNEDEKLLVKLDWYINDQHRAALTYNYNDGFNIVESDGDADEFEFSNHLYERGAELESWSGTLYSDWTDTFSTEIRIGTLELDNRQISVGGTDFGEIRVELEDRPGLDDIDVYLGGDDSRQSNKLDYEVLNVSLTANWQVGDHSITFGYELEDLDIFNLFIQHTETEIRFSGIDDFRNGFANAIYYNNAPSNNPTDAAADWGYSVNTVFIQDEFNIGDRFELLLGLRYDWWESDDEPVVNQTFLNDYGFGNNNTVDGEGLLQPRLGFTYYPNDSLTVRGGVGLYAGGDPNVWLSNNFSNNNVLQFGQRGRSFGYTDGSRSLFDDDVVYAGLEAGVPAGPGYGVPQELFDAVAGGTGDNFEINYLDPDFEIPSEWKFSLGATYQFGENWVVTGDLLVTRGQDTAIVQRGDLEQVGTTAEGYPQYDSVREPSFVFTNSSEGNESTVVSVSLSKAYDFGLDWRLGYAYTDAEDVQPMTSSVAFSNYVNRAFFDPQEDRLSRSNYSIEHRFTLVVNYERMFFGDNRTIFSVYASANEGQPYSFAFNGTINPYGFTPFLDFADNVLAPGDDRNDQDGAWWGKVDVRVEQEFGIGPGKASAFIVIDNLTNLLNDEWGVLRQSDFPNNVNRNQNQFEPRVGDASRSEIRFGVRYAF